MPARHHEPHRIAVRVVDVERAEQRVPVLDDAQSPAVLRRTAPPHVGELPDERRQLRRARRDDNEVVAASPAVIAHRHRGAVRVHDRPIGHARERGKRILASVRDQGIRGADDGRQRRRNVERQRAPVGGYRALHIEAALRERDLERASAGKRRDVLRRRIDDDRSARRAETSAGIDGAVGREQQRRGRIHDERSVESAARAVELERARPRDLDGAAAGELARHRDVRLRVDDLLARDVDRALDTKRAAGIEEAARRRVQRHRTDRRAARRGEDAERALVHRDGGRSKRLHAAAAKGPRVARDGAGEDVVAVEERGVSAHDDRRRGRLPHVVEDDLPERSGPRLDLHAAAGEGGECLAGILSCGPGDWVAATEMTALAAANVTPVESVKIPPVEDVDGDRATPRSG